MDPLRLPRRARVVIIGAGVVGSSAAYYLTRYGWNDVVVLDQGPLFQVLGSTSHAPGLVFQTNPSRTVCRLAQWTVQLYRELGTASEGPCFYPVGSIEVACSRERHQELKRRAGLARSWGLPARILTPEEVGSLIPQIDTRQVYSGYHVPSDGLGKGVRILKALAREAGSRGALFVPDARVTAIESHDGRVTAVVCNQGRIEAEAVLLCAGIWGPRVGKLAGIPVPMQPMQHLYARTGPLSALAGASEEVTEPILRHQDRSMYSRQDFDRYGVGSYRHEPLPVNVESLGLDPSGAPQAALRPFPSHHFENALADSRELFPCLRGASFPFRINGIFAFTPDGQSLLGRSAQLEGFWLAEGVWLTHGGGVGRAIAQYMVEGLPPLDLRDLDCNRFHAHVHSRPYVLARGRRQYREVYDIIHPRQQIERPRRLRLSPFHPRLEELGGEMFESAGWERPQWFAASERLPGPEGGYTRQGWSARFWSPLIGSEHRAARERVCLFDLTPFTKLEVAGPGSLSFLQHLAANQMDRPPGRITYTSMLNRRGGMEADLTVTRLEEERFWVITGGATGRRDLAWLRSHLERESPVQIRDLTSAYCCLGVWGPAARELVQSVSENDLSDQTFPYLTARRIYVRQVPVLALRISYVGELGWELYAPTEYGLQLWDTLWAAGRPWGVAAAGGGAFESLRLEKGYRLWGADVHTEYNPLEAGLGFAVRMDKENFLGRAALQRVAAEGVSRKWCCLRLEDPDTVLMGSEPVRFGGNRVGYVTSADFGYTVQESLAFSYLPTEVSPPGTRLEIDYFEEPQDATVVSIPRYDPGNRRLTG
jgi:glycine cleavage system aminomethyltransferase T/glycine/D-amino acid oxidase-like deaminating enzyme